MPRYSCIQFSAIHRRISPVHCLLCFAFLAAPSFFQLEPTDLSGISKLPNNSSFRLVFLRSSAAFLFLSLSPWSRKGCDAARASPQDDHRATQSGLDFLTSTSIYINSSKARVVECGTVNEWRSKGTRTVPGPAAPTAAASPTWTSRELKTENTQAAALKVLRSLDRSRARGDRSPGTRWTNK